MNDIKLELRNVAAGYEDKPILKNVNCIVHSGEICCLLGPNGVGKTTLFKTILGLIPPVSGQVLMDGRDTSAWNAKQLADNIAYVSQFHNPPFPYKVKDVVLLGRVSQAGYFGKVSELDYEIAQQAIVDMGVAHLADKPYTDISGGERQLVMIARALTQQPKWLMMDEPTASLDYGNMIRVISRIVELRDRGYGIIMTTHLPDQAFMCDAKVGLLQRGSSMKFGDAADIITEENMRETYGVGVSVAELFDRSGHLMRMCVPEIGSYSQGHPVSADPETPPSRHEKPDITEIHRPEKAIQNSFVDSGKSRRQRNQGTRGTIPEPSTSSDIFRRQGNRETAGTIPEPEGRKRKNHETRRPDGERALSTREMQSRTGRTAPQHNTRQSSGQRHRRNHDHGQNNHRNHSVKILKTGRTRPHGYGVSPITSGQSLRHSAPETNPSGDRQLRSSTGSLPATAVQGNSAGNSQAQHRVKPETAQSRFHQRNPAPAGTSPSKERFGRNHANSSLSPGNSRTADHNSGSSGWDNPAPARREATYNPQDRGTSFPQNTAKSAHDNDRWKPTGDRYAHAHLPDAFRTHRHSDKERHRRHRHNALHNTDN